MYTGRRLSLTDRLRNINKRRPSPVKTKQENKQRRKNCDLLSKTFEKKINDTFDLSEEEGDVISKNESEQKSCSASGSDISIKEDNCDGFDLSLKGLDLKNLSFLTKFMAQFKKIKNIDMGESKL